jgi:hypothetical protein
MLNTTFRPFFVLILVFSQLSPRQSLAPGNDSFTNAESIASLPFSIELDVSDATLEPDEPQTCLPTDRSVWYTFIPSRSMILIADTLASSATKISIYRANGPGITDLESVQCVSPGGAITFAVDPGQTYYFQVGAVVGEMGTVPFSLSEVTGITGRVTDAVTSLPLPGDSPPFALVSLLWVCGDNCLSLVSSLPTSSDGRFRFDNYFGTLGGTYLIEVSAAAYETRRFGPFEFSGANLEVGDLAISPLPRIDSISGRLVDGVTGKPISTAFPSFVQLFRCTDGNCSDLVNSQAADSQAQFRFEADWRGNPLTAGTYQIWASAEQYQQKITDPFSIGEGMYQILGNLSLTSFPIRFSDVEPCADIPASGGECAFSLRIWNGLTTKFRGKTWSMVNASLPESTVGASDFQLNVPKVLELDRGRSKVVRFRFNIPGSSSPATAFICPRVFVGRGNSFRFNTVGFTELFCVLRNPQGLSIVTPHDATALAQPSVIAAATGTETEPNNSCQTAQDVGAVPFPFVVDGNLDSTLQPDIDFYRFSGTPGVLIGIDHEGQPTGKGTLEDPLLAFFDSGCNLLAVNNDTNSANARLEIPIPSDGIFIVAATTYPDFALTGGGNGSYQLTTAPVPLIGSISGRLTDIFRTSLRGDVEPFAFVRLLQCGEFGCFDVNSQAANSEGRFLFETDLNGAPLRAGNYQLIVTANQYREGQTEPFAVGEGEHHDVGDFILDSFAVRFSDIQPCSIPAAGGICKFSLRITNGLSTRLSGKTWSTAGGAWIGSFTNFTSFQTGKARAVELEPGKSKILHFGFRVPGSVADGATICASVYIGQKPSAFFRPVGITGLFCLTKGAGGLRLMSAQDAQAASQQMKMLRIDPAKLPTNKMK